jgi:o-succinylbenzoate synthase
MKIRHSLYQLISKRPIHAKKTHTTRPGALLQVEFDDGTLGYADCHPWEELGDLPLQTQLELLKSGKCTRLTARSLYFAKADAKARADRRNLLDPRIIPKSHYLVTLLDETSLADIKMASEKGFTHFKLKMGNDLKREEELIRELIKLFPKARLRLDFNAKLSREEFISFLDRISSAIPSIDFIEDPFSFNYASWRQIQETFSVALAADEFYKTAYGHPEAAKILIMKPAVHTLKSISSGQRLITTSYLDHPIGQISAAYMASLAKTSLDHDEICGLLSHETYEMNPFSQMIDHNGPALQAVQGYGLGFDELLSKQNFV